ncbi:unnamed protein product [Prunus armeniaca]|uniref:Uncharacterized protein n=1 Tax=Prunus armeniaca TaxID=36596 RepID=A0A6J5VP11_PRUAR|nr:unnamed protein product [Prunus armeniaca]CAB4320380.1 unnamed protein product [Prunus armeniaca]
MTTKIVEQTSEVEEHDHIQSEAEEELEAAVEPPSSPLGQRKPHRSREICGQNLSSEAENS